MLAQVDGIAERSGLVPLTVTPLIDVGGESTVVSDRGSASRINDRLVQAIPGEGALQYSSRRWGAKATPEGHYAHVVFGTRAATVGLPTALSKG